MICRRMYIYVRNEMITFVWGIRVVVQFLLYNLSKKKLLFKQKKLNKGTTHIIFFSFHNIIVAFQTSYKKKKKSCYFKILIVK